MICLVQCLNCIPFADVKLANNPYHSIMPYTGEYFLEVYDENNDNNDIKNENGD